MPCASVKIQSLQQNMIVSMALDEGVKRIVAKQHGDFLVRANIIIFKYMIMISETNIYLDDETLFRQIGIILGGFGEIATNIIRFSAINYYQD